MVVFTARGLMPPVFTPLHDDHTINYTAIPDYAKYLANAGIKSVLVGGTTGEHMSLSVEDRKKVIDAWVKVAKTTGLHIQVQVGGAPMLDVLDLASYCQKVGADSLLTLPELYFKPDSVDSLVDYVELVAKAAPNLPVLYYHIPSMSKVEINMPAFVTKATARIPNFKGIKFTSNDLSEGAQVLRALKDGQEMFLGADTLIAPAALLGIKSSIGTTWNLFPRLAQEILEAVEKNDVAKARSLQEKLSLAIEAHSVEGPWVPIMKAGMEIVSGIKVGPPSLPQKPISEEARKRIENFSSNSIEILDICLVCPLEELLLEMSKQVAVMPSLEVIVERLPKAVIDAVIGSVEVSISGIMESIQRPVTLKSSVKTEALLRNVAMKSMPSLRVTLERLPKDVMIDLLARKKIFCMTLEKRKISKPRKIRSSLYKYDNV